MASPTVLTRAVPTTVQTAVRAFRGPNDSPELPGKKVIDFWVDVVSGCHLRCTACPVGRPDQANNIGQKPTGMLIDLFETIGLKAKADTDGNCRFWLYNWTEPTLQSRLQGLIACAESDGVPCGNSCNLHHDDDVPIDAMVDGLETIPAEPESIHCSPHLVPQAIGEDRSHNCFVRESQFCLDHGGKFSTCRVQSPSAPSIANDLDSTLQAMQARRDAGDRCKTCTGGSGTTIFATDGIQEPPEIQQRIEDLLPVDLKSFR